MSAEKSATKKEDGSRDTTPAPAANGAPTTTDAQVTPGAPSPTNASPSAPVQTSPPAETKAKVPLIAMNMQVSETTGDWIMSRLSNEGAPVYHFTGVQYRVFETPPAGTDVQPLYRCTDAAGTHFQSNDAQCENAGKLESLLGYVYRNDPGNGAKLIQRCIGESGVPIVSTTRDADCDPFIRQPVTLGYAFDANVLEATP